MIKLRIKFGNEDDAYKFHDIVDGELLSEAVDRITTDLPPDSKRSDIFIAIVNGQTITAELWDKVKLKSQDDVLIAPRIQGGDFGQIFKQVLLITVAIVATVLLKNPQLGLSALQVGLAVGGITLASSLALNALIPPPGLDFGGLGDFADFGVESSQMYSIQGQSNQIKRLGVVPKVYGSHRMFPPLAANPYTELAVDPDTGEVIQYLCAIYDFGLGSPVISDIKIGDTPLSTDSFRDFEFNLVDPNEPDPEGDEDPSTFTSFTLYNGDRSVEPLSFSLTNGTEFIQNSEPNTLNVDQEIILDFVCPQGLYGYSSGGTLGDRTINLTIEFAEVGTSNWHGYNDLDYVDSFRAVGGTDFTDFRVPVFLLQPDDADFSDFFEIREERQGFWGTYNSPNLSDSGNFSESIYLKKHTSQCAMAKPGPTDNWQINVGTKVFLDSRIYIGVITAVVDEGTYYRVSFDREHPDEVTRGPVGRWTYYKAANSPTKTYEGSGTILKSYLSSRHTVGAATITGSRTNPVFASYRFTPSTPAQYKIRVRRISTTGDFTQQTGDALTWGALTTNFQSSPINTTKRHLFMELKIRATDQLNGTVQNLSAIVSQPVDVYDPDTETWTPTITSNPAWIFCDLLTGEVNKKAVDRSRLHLESILEWAEYCDTIPTPPPSQTYLEPRFQCNFILDYDSTLQEVLNSVTGAAQASLNIIDGQYGVLIDKEKTVPVQIFTPRNSSGFSSSRFYAPRPHAVRVKFIDPNLNWEVSEAIVYDNGYDATTATEFDDLTSFACTNYEQAWRFGRYMIAQNRLRQETISLLVDFENLVCTRGDYVQVTQDVMQVGGRPARVNKVTGSVVHIDDAIDVDPDITNWGYTFRASDGTISTSTLTVNSSREFDLDGTIPAVGDLIIIGEVGNLVLDCIIKSIQPNDDMSAQLVLVERANEIFEYESAGELPDYDPQISRTSSPEIRPPNAVTELTAESVEWECSDSQSGYDYSAYITWDIPAGSIYEHFEIYYNNGAGYRSVGTTNEKSWTQLLDQSRVGTTMGIKVAAVAASGNKLQLVEMSEVTFETSPHTDPPADVEDFASCITQQVLQLTWSMVDDCDVFRYEIRYSPETNDLWEASTQLQVVDRSVNSISVQARTGVYHIKAIDFAGNQSENASSIVTSIPNLFELNIIEELNDAPGFAGHTEQAVALGAAIILEERTPGDVDTVEYYSDGYYVVANVVDLGDIYSARLQSLIRADGYRYGELMTDWDTLEDVDALNTATTDDWNCFVEYRATNEILPMSSWEHLYDVPTLGEGAGDGFTDWRPLPTIGDATGRVFQFRVRLQSLTANVTPRLFDATIKVDMPDRLDSIEDETSSAVAATSIIYATPFYGPGDSPLIQISIQNAQTGDYWTISNKSLEGFNIRFYDNTNTQVVRIFDVAAKGYGSRSTDTI